MYNFTHKKCTVLSVLLCRVWYVYQYTFLYFGQVIQTTSYSVLLSTFKETTHVLKYTL